MDFFSDFQLNIPNLWDKDWDEAISEAEGISKEILKVQHSTVKLLKYIDDYRLTPERLAWITIWTRVFSSLEAALLAISKNSEFSLKLISRAIFEDSIRVQILMRSSSNDCSSHIKNDMRSQLFDSLCAYTAWCLWNDKHQYLVLME